MMENGFPPLSAAGFPQGSKLSSYLAGHGGEPVSSAAVTSSLGSLSLTSSPVGKGVSLPPGRPYTPEGATEGGVPLTLDGVHSVENVHADAAAGLFEENVGGTTYYYTAEDAAAQAPAQPATLSAAFTAYVPPPPRLADVTKPPSQAALLSGEHQRELLLRNQALTLMHPNPAAYPDLPVELDNYHELCPLEPPNQPHKSTAFGYVTTCYKATNMKTGLHYCLRRIHGLRLSGTKCLLLVTLWSKMDHPHVVTLRELFTTKAFGDNSVVFVYDYIAGAETLLSRHLNQPPQHNGFGEPFAADSSSSVRPYGAQKATALRPHGALLSESLIWSFVIQLTGLLRHVHSRGLACRVLDPTKVLVTGEDRLRINCCGILDVVTFDNSAANPLALIPHYQQEDLVGLGKLLLALSCNSVLAVQRENFNTSIGIVERNYSADLKTLIMGLLLPSAGRQRGIDDVMPAIGARFYTQLEASRHLAERLEDDLDREVQNGRLVRLLTKLTAVTERAEQSADDSCMETGDRYMLKLFRDYVFHAVTDEGRPFLDMAHVVQSLNKLDAGASEKICLMSRDMQNVLVVTYAELKQCFQRSFLEIYHSGAADMTGDEAT